MAKSLGKYESAQLLSSSCMCVH